MNMESPEGNGDRRGEIQNMMYVLETKMKNLGVFDGMNLEVESDALVRKVKIGNVIHDNFPEIEKMAEGILETILKMAEDGFDMSKERESYESLMAGDLVDV